MKSENKNCQNCKQDFIIEAEDFSFYEKMKVPAPKVCPRCRFKMRSVWRNEKALYSRICARCSKPTLSMYHSESPYIVWCKDCWISDDWDPLDYGKEYDPKRPFFEQFEELLHAVPKAGIFQSTDLGPNINSEYTNFVGGNKDCYLIFNSGPNNENCAYSRGLIKSRDAFDVYGGDNIESSYEGISLHKSSGVVWGHNAVDCIDSWFVENGVGLQNCFGCVNLRHKSLHFLNEPISLEEYTKRINEIRGSYHAMEEFRKKFEKFSLNFPRREHNNYKSVNCSGDYVFESKNCKECFDISFCEDVRYSNFVKFAKDSYDILGHGRKSELLLEGVAVGTSSRVIGSWWTISSHDVSYSFGARSCEYCFGCDSVHNGKFLILNKQYSEEEYRLITSQIISELTDNGLYGLYFPSEIAPFAYNETIAQENFPLTKEEAVSAGFHWQDNLQMTVGKETMTPEQIPDHIRDVSDGILKETLVCIECRRNYRLTASELQFYRKMLIPIPRKCFFCRYDDRIRRRGPFILFDRECGKCGQKIKTNYSPDRPEIVYCEKCYQQEVY